jgi:hypothetical protein
VNSDEQILFPEIEINARAGHAKSYLRNAARFFSLLSLITNHCIPGGQGRIRTSVDRMGRQIYSLLLLTAQPPVLNLGRRIPPHSYSALRTPGRLRPLAACNLELAKGFEPPTL